MIDSFNLKDGVILNNVGMNLSAGFVFPKLAVWRAYRSGIFATASSRRPTGRRTCHCWARKKAAATDSCSRLERFEGLGLRVRSFSVC